MDGFSVVLGSALALLGLYGLYFAASGKSALTDPITRFLFAVRRREEPSRAYTALTSATLITWGLFFVLLANRPQVPLWLSLAVLFILLALQVAALLQRQDV